MSSNCDLDELSAGSEDDSDILEIAVIPPKGGADQPAQSPAAAKRRRSSPLLDPIPSYTPTPLYILEQRARAMSNNMNNNNNNDQSLSGLTCDRVYEQVDYSPTPISANYLDYYGGAKDWESSISSQSHSNYSTDYTPLLEPSPSVVGRTTARRTSISPPATSRPLKRPATSRPPRPSATALQPVSSALAQAVARRRNSQVETPTSSTGPSASTIDSGAAHRSVAAYFSKNPVSSSSAYAEKPVMWSPQLPSQIQPVKTEADRVTVEDGGEEDYSKYKSPRVSKQRVAHKPIVTQRRREHPRTPLGVSKKVPSALRIKYLDVIITEYLNTGQADDESYQMALKEEQALANRAANKSIYINLVAGLKKRIREKAGISTLPQDEDPKFVNGNKVVSHSEILTGKVTGTFSIERKRKDSDPNKLNEYDLYDRLLRYIVPLDQLEAYGYPCRDPNDPSLRKVPLGKDGQRQQLRPELAEAYTCERCSKVYRIGPDGMPLVTTNKCIYHPGHLWNERINRSLEKRYSCCKGDQSAGGCSSNPYHVHRGELELANYKGYVETEQKSERDPNKHGIYALDCEMCYTTYGLELTRITVINYKSDVVYEKLVRPENPILDYNTKFSGIKEGDLDCISTSLADVQKDLLRMFSSKSILVGHSLDSDMKALKIFHKRFIDTAQLFPHKRGLPYKRALRTLMVENLQVIIQEDVGHDSKEDASAAFRLVMWKVKTDVPEKSK